MHFDSVEQILAQLEQQPGWSKFRDYRQLLKVWHNTVNKNTAKNTRPLYISRQVLWVATNSASRAQELSFQRYALLKRLNKQLPFVIKDIRFSSSGFERSKDTLPDTKKILFTIRQQRATTKPKNNLRNLPVDNRDIENSRDKSSLKKNARVAVKRWLKAIEQSNQKPSLSSCPECDVPTPLGELERWNLCYLCVSKKWSKKYRSPKFPESE